MAAHCTAKSAIVSFGGADAAVGGKQEGQLLHLQPVVRKNQHWKYPHSWDGIRYGDPTATRRNSWEGHHLQRQQPWSRPEEHHRQQEEHHRQLKPEVQWRPHSWDGIRCGGPTVTRSSSRERHHSQQQQQQPW